MESEKIEKDIDGYNTRPLLSGRVFCACGNGGWRKSACTAAGDTGGTTRKRGIGGKRR